MLLMSVLYGQTGTIQTLADALGTDDTPSGYYNIAASTASGNQGGFQIAVSGFVNGGKHAIDYSTDGTNFTSLTGYGSGGISGNPSGQTAFNIDISHSIITSTFTPTEGTIITFKVTSLNASFQYMGDVIPTADDGGYQGSGNDFFYDLTRPTVTSLTDYYIKQGQTTVLTGTGFNTGGSASAVRAGSNSLSYVVNSDAQITITGGTGNFTGILYATDAAGNTSSASGVTYTVDNTPPQVSSVNAEAIRNGQQATITGSGFYDTPSSPIASVQIGGSTPSGMTKQVLGDTQIQITAGSGETGYNSITVTDEAGNVSTATLVKIAIDNTPPSISNVDQSLARESDVIVVDGTGFTTSGISTNPTITIGGSSTSSLNISNITYSATQITFTVGNVEISNGTIVITDVAGNASTETYKLTIDNTAPTVSSVDTRYLKANGQAIIYGSGFTTNGNATAVQINSTVPTGLSFEVNSNTQMTITAGSGQITDGNITVTDAAGNVSTNSGILVTIDNTAPIVTSLGSSDPDIIKNGSTITINGSGFNTGAPILSTSTPAGVTVGGSVPTGMTFAVDNNTQITITAGSGAADGNVVVTDAAGNSSVATGINLAIDNTAPTVTTVSPATSSQTVVKKGATVVITGSGFTNSGYSGSNSTVYLGSTNFTNYGTVVVDNSGQITLTVSPTSTANVSGNLKVVDFAGNSTTVTANTLYIDNTLPTISLIADPVLADGAGTTITGTGFKTGTLVSTLLVDGTTPTGFSYSVDSNTQITITAGSGEITDGQITITDPAGNASTSDARITIDNTTPIVTSVGTSSIKNGATSVISGSGFFTTINGVSDGTGLTLTVGGSVPAGMTFTVDSDNQITITAGGGQVTAGNVVVTDRAGNSSTQTGKLLTIDNTAPTISSVSPGSIKLSASSTVTGSGFTVGGNPQSVLLNGTTPAGMTYSVVSNTEITIFAGSGEITDAQITVRDAAGNLSTSAVYLTIDNTPPVVTSVLPAVIRNGQSSIITGSGFTVGGDATAVLFGGSVPTGLTWTVDSNTQITVTAGSGELTNANVTVTDSAGNVSVDTGKLLTIDNTKPTVTAVSARWLKSGESATITGTGFTANGNATSVKIGGIVPTGMTFVVNSNTQITVTAGSGQITRGLIQVTDFAGNTSVNTTVKLSIDNTAPATPTLALDPNYDSGFFANDRISNFDNPAFNVSGTVAGDSVYIEMEGNPVLGLRCTGATGTLYWGLGNQSIAGNTSITGGSGIYSFTITAIDSAGNQSAASAALNYIFDIDAPSAPSSIVVPPAYNSGESNTDKIINDNTPVLQMGSVTVGNVLRIEYRENDPDPYTVVSTSLDTIDAVPFTVSILNTLNDGSSHDFLLFQIDTAGNESGTYFENLIIDTDQPTAALSYSDSLVRASAVPVTITATFDDGMNSAIPPTVSVNFPGTGTDLTNVAMAATFNDSVWVYALTIPDDIDGTAIVTVNGSDNAGNALLTAATTGTSLLRIDNTEPVLTSIIPDSNSYVNTMNATYRISETAASGSVTYTRIGGSADPASPHIVQLTGGQLTGTILHSVTLTPAVPLVDGSIYRMNWSVTDSAGNSNLTTIRTPVTYDLTPPSVSLAYSQYIANGGTSVTITGTFSETVKPTPQLSINYAGSDDVPPSPMTLTAGTDSTIWTFVTVVPTGVGNNGIAVVNITGIDLATNALPTDSIAYNDTLMVDNTPPGVTFDYENLTNPDIADAGKAGDIIRVTATFNDRMATPTLDIQFIDTLYNNYPNNGAPVSDSVWVYDVTFPAGIANTGTVTILSDSRDYAGNAITSFLNNDIFECDNTPPLDFATGSVTPIATNPVSFWINNTTTQLAMNLTVSSTTADPSLYNGGEIAYQMFNLVRGTQWKTIGTANDSIEHGGANTIYRDVADIVTTTALQTGDSLISRAVIFDRVGNQTFGDTSLTVFHYDPNSPVFAGVPAGVPAIDTVYSSDQVQAAWNAFDEPDGNSESGVVLYEYSMDYAAVGDTTGFAGWTTVAADTVLSVIKPLTHANLYNIYLRSWDRAGNVSIVENISPKIYRINTSPILTSMAAVLGYEDIAYTDTIKVTDADLTTLLGDEFRYYATTARLVGLPALSEITVDSLTGSMAWTPTQADTGSYAIQVRVNDNWGFSDTLTFTFFVEAVNDTPTVDILAPDNNISFDEDHTDTVSINLTQYAHDVDNDSTTLSWQVVILDTTSKPGFPTGRVITGPGTPFTVKNYLREKYSGRNNRAVSKRPQKMDKPLSLSTAKSFTEKISVSLDTLNGITYATFDADSNYYGANHRLIFYATDLSGAMSSDTILVTIVPENDPPQWQTIPTISILENDFLALDVSAFATDVDDTLLSFEVSALTNSGYISISPASFSTNTIGDSVIFTPQLLWSDSARIRLVVTDARSATDTTEFTLDIVRVLRPNLSIAVVQNNAFSNYFNIVVTDSVEKTESLTLTVQSQPVALDTVAAFTYVGNHDFVSAGTYRIEAHAVGVVGDTSIIRQVGLTQARTFGNWYGSSPDGIFRVNGTTGAVIYDQPILVVDSTMFAPTFYGKASYLMGNEVMGFEKPVLVSIASSSPDVAIYQRSNGVSWTELPSLTTESGVMQAYTDKMGYFRRGPKTILVPEETKLASNYPNPFNPYTTIVFDVGFFDGPLQKINISVYNILGEHVTTLFNDYKNIGRHEVSWNGRNAVGNNMSSGIYFILLTSNAGVRKSQKVMLIR